MSSPQPQQSHAPRTSARRRQRSTRLTVAAALLVLSALLVGWAVVDGTVWLQGVAAVVAVVLGAAATRITHSELLAERRTAARDRAVQAMHYREITAQRTAENDAFAADMRRKILDRQEAISVLEVALSKAQRLAADQTLKLGNEARRADGAERAVAGLGRALEAAESRASEAAVRVVELEAEIDVLKADLASLKSAHAARSTRSA